MEKFEKIDLSQYPLFNSVPVCSKVTGIPAFRIREFCKSGKVHCFNSGRVFKVNLESLVNYLNSEEVNDK